MATTSAPIKACWATLLTKTSYLAGALVMHASLLKHSKYPFVVFATPEFPAEGRDVLKERGVLVRDIEYLEPDKNGVETLELDEHDRRFADTWTKLRCFELVEYDRVIMVDSDMLVLQNMDELMSIDLPNDWIAASHACTCNPRKLPHYPSDWIPANCAHTLATTLDPLPSSLFSKPTHHLLNSGLVIFSPSHTLFGQILDVLNTNPAVKLFKFPDQDLLALVFKDRFKSLSWRYNALKLMRVCHEGLWKDEAVKNVHYIMDKPWERKIGKENPNYELHQLWWDAWEELDQESKDLPHWDVVAAHVKA